MQRKHSTRGLIAPAAATLLGAAAALATVPLATAALVVAPALGATATVPYAIKPATGMIAFVRDTIRSPATVWVADAQGSRARRLGPGELPAVSPEGTIVAVASSSGGAVLLYSGTGKLLHKFATAGTPSPGNGLTPFSWSPDSRYLAVQVGSTAINGVTGAGLAVIDTTTDAYKLIAKGVINGASFAVDGTDRIVYGVAPSLSEGAPANLYTIDPDGSANTKITTDGRSLDPLWGASGIAFDRERFRGPDAAPALQVWLSSGTHLRQLTNIKIPALLAGLVPLAFSANGNRMIAEYEGEDTSYAWTIQLSPLRVRQLPGFVQAGGISRTGNSLLIDSGAFMAPDSNGVVESVPFSGKGAAHKLTRGGLPSWNL